MDHIVANVCPGRAQFRVAYVMAHGGSAGRKNCDVGASLALKLQLCGLQFFANLIVADLRRRRRLRGIAEGSDLLLAELDKSRRLGSVMSVTINNHLDLRCRAK